MSEFKAEAEKLVEDFNNGLEVSFEGAFNLLENIITESEEQQKQIDKLNKERIEWIAVTSEMESEINELKAGEDWYKNRLAELNNKG